MPTYIHGLPDWPEFRWDNKVLAEPIAAVRHRQGRLVGRMEGLGFPLRSEAILQSLTEEVVKSSEIEGAMLDREAVRSSIARRLGIDIGALTPADRDVESVVESSDRYLVIAKDGIGRRYAARHYPRAHGGS